MKRISLAIAATREFDKQALEQILIGHMMAVCGEANQIFRQVTISEHGIDGEVEFKDNNGKPSGKKIYIWLSRPDDRQLEICISQHVDVYLVLRQSDERATNSSREEAVSRWFDHGEFRKHLEILDVKRVDSLNTIGQHRRHDLQVEYVRASDRVTLQELHPSRHNVSGCRQHMEPRQQQQRGKNSKRFGGGARFWETPRVGDDRIKLAEYLRGQIQRRGRITS
jgi:hypothetical protein